MELNMNQKTKTAGEPLIRILHPSDFSKASRVAFAHALEIAMTSRQRRIFTEASFPGIRETLVRWNIALLCQGHPSCVRRLIRFKGTLIFLRSKNEIV
jgi:hypothetical protein